MTQTVSPEEREAAAAAALERLIGKEAGATFRELLPRKPWLDVVDRDFWLRRDVLEAQDVAGRQRLYRALVGAIGGDHASTLMELLPPVNQSLLPRGGLELDAPYRAA